MLHAKLDHGSV